MSFIRDQLDPSEILGELLFGAIMVLTFTLGASVAGGYEKGLLLAAVGCNVAWGVIDGVLVVMSHRYERRRDALERAQPASISFAGADWATGFAVFLLVVGSALPAALPFLVIPDPHQALRVSNALMLAVLFVAGWIYGRHIDMRPWLAGLILTAIGTALVAIAVALGG